MLQAAARNADRMAEIREEYTDRFPGQWIAVAGTEVYGPAASPEELRRLLEREGVDIKVAKAALLDPAYRIPAAL
jgi:hypothetical protein